MDGILFLKIMGIELVLFLIFLFLLWADLKLFDKHLIPKKKKGDKKSK